MVRKDVVFDQQQNKNGFVLGIITETFDFCTFSLGDFSNGFICLKKSKKKTPLSDTWQKL